MPSKEQILECTEFLGQLTQMGAPLGNLRTVEEAYWELLEKPAPTPYDQATPFRYNGMPDYEKVTPMLQHLGSSPLCSEADDCFWELIWWAGDSSNDDDARTQARQMSVAALWSVAVVVTLALKAGVNQDNKKNLISLVVRTVR